MKKSILAMLSALCVLTCLGLTSACSEQSDVWDPYYDWQKRNAQWYETIADSARNAIAQAKRQYADDWEAHCDWRMYKTYMKSESVVGPLTYSVCVHILKRGTGTVTPAYTDSVKLNFRGWIMPTEYVTPEGTLATQQAVFSQTYYGDFNPDTATPQQMAVSSTVEGFATALQYMVAGDDWLVYIPQNMAYGENGSSAIPSYSTLQFQLNVTDVIERRGTQTSSSTSN